MSIRKVSFASGEHYHLYNRGNNKQQIFFEERDYMRFMSLLYLCNTTKNFIVRNVSVSPYEFDRGETLVHIGAYCLMPNHFHIAIKEKEEGGVSKFMQKLSTAYVMYINNKYQRSGGLFEGKFKSEHLASDRYLKYIFSYIHLNPAKLIINDWRNKVLDSDEKRKLLSFLEDYNFSSYKDFAGEERAEGKILSSAAFPKYFASSEEFLTEIGSWVSFNEPA